jgi:hypothetical protein
MRGLPVVIAVLLLAGWSSGLRRARTPVEDASLTAAQIEHYVSAYQPNVRACYVQHALGVRTATGVLALQIRISPAGDVAEVLVRAPGITGNRLGALTACVREEVTTWHFPVAREETVAELPYVFHRYDLRQGGAVASR